MNTRADWLEMTFVSISEGITGISRLLLLSISISTKTPKKYEAYSETKKQRETITNIGCVFQKLGKLDIRFGEFEFNKKEARDGCLPCCCAHKSHKTCVNKYIFNPSAIEFKTKLLSY